MTSGDDDPLPSLADAGSVVRPRRRWRPESNAETAAMLKLLATRPWLVGGRDDEHIATVRRNLPALRDSLARLGWVLVVERDLVRLRKSPPPRRAGWATDGPTPLQASWFFLLLAGAESVAPRVSIAQLVAAARAAAAEAGLPVTNDIVERRAIVHALTMLDLRGLVMAIDGDVDGFADDEHAPVLLAVHHARLVHVIANPGTSNPAADPSLWLEQVEREPDPARRMRRRLVDDTLVHACDLDSGESEWLSRRVRGDDGGPLADAFGLQLERRTEGAAFVVPDDAFRFQHELGSHPFPAPGTVAHAALLLCEHAAVSGTVASSGVGPGGGWLGLRSEEVTGHVARLIDERAGGRGGWRREYVEAPASLVEDVRLLLCALDLLRLAADGGEGTVWWFSPATGRWSPVTRAPEQKR